MLNSNRRPPDLLKEKNEDAKRTTIILEKSERQFIESLIKDGKELGIKPLISKKERFFFYNLLKPMLLN